METEISKLNIHGTVCNLKDSGARTDIQTLNEILNSNSLENGKAIVWNNTNKQFESSELSDKLTDSDFDDIFN